MIKETIRFREKWYDEFLVRLKDAIKQEKKLAEELKFIKKSHKKAQDEVRLLHKEFLIK